MQTELRQKYKDNPLQYFVKYPEKKKSTIDTLPLAPQTLQLVLFKGARFGIYRSTLAYPLVEKNDMESI